MEITLTSWTIMWRYDQPQALALVKRSLAQSLPVYALFTSMQEIGGRALAVACHSRASVDAYRWF
jgi:hypothetical protein